MPSRFPPPWKIIEEPGCFTVQDANGFSITWFWWNASEVIGTNPDRMTQKQARAMAVKVHGSKDAVAEAAIMKLKP